MNSVPGRKLIAGYSKPRQNYSRPKENLKLLRHGEKVSDIIRRGDIYPGLEVAVVLKQDQRTGKLTNGIVKNILTKSSTHPHGIKVRLTSGLVGRVKQILDEGSSQVASGR